MRETKTKKKGKREREGKTERGRVNKEISVTPAYVNNSLDLC